MFSLKWWVQNVSTSDFTELYSSLRWRWTLQWLFLCSWHITHTWSFWRCVPVSHLVMFHNGCYIVYNLYWIEWCPLGNLDEHMHLVAPVLVRLFKVELVDIRRRAIVTLTKLIPKVQVGWCSYWVWYFVNAILTRMVPTLMELSVCNAHHVYITYPYRLVLMFRL